MEDRRNGWFGKMKIVIMTTCIAKGLESQLSIASEFRFRLRLGDGLETLATTLKEIVNSNQ